MVELLAGHYPSLGKTEVTEVAEWIKHATPTQLLLCIEEVINVLSRREIFSASQDSRFKKWCKTSARHSLSTGHCEVMIDVQKFMFFLMQQKSKHQVKLFPSRKYNLCREIIKGCWWCWIWDQNTQIFSFICTTHSMLFKCRFFVWIKYLNITDFSHLFKVAI